MANEQNVVALAERYYDSDDADRFYFHVWGGQDIHIGIYEQPGESIRQASERSVQLLAQSLDGAGPDTRVLDLGAGYGGAARYLATRFGCHVTCLNLSETQNRRNREFTQDAALSHRIRIVHGNFERVFEPDASFDVVWSQDAILHSADRTRVMGEARRVLKPGGLMIFTDPMQADEVPDGVLAPVLERIHLDSMGSFGFYHAAARELGMVAEATTVLTPHLITHYARVREELTRRREELEGLVSRAYIDRMLIGLTHWVQAAEAGHLAWGVMRYRVPT
ncbi:MAG: methyltransferase domain-containing protein [Myxococcales bacterium]|nr:methyltransferase domain-containing protein [Myxococcales bacterium]